MNATVKTLMAFLAVAMTMTPADAEGAPFVRRTAPYDFGCTGTASGALCTPSDDARKGVLTHLRYLTVGLVYYAPPFVGSAQSEATSFAGIDLRFTRAMSFRSITSVRALEGGVTTEHPEVCASLWIKGTNTLKKRVCTVVGPGSYLSWRLDFPRLPAGRYRLTIAPRVKGLYGAGLVKLEAIAYTWSPV